MAKFTQSDRLNYSGVVCDHLMKISKAAEGLFNIIDNAEGGSTLPTRRSRMYSFYSQVVLLESFLYPNFSDEYHKKTYPVKRVIEKSLDSDMVTFNRIQFILQKVMQEANNMNLLFPEKNAAKEFEQGEEMFEE